MNNVFVFKILVTLQDLKKLLDNSKNGLIYFSMGSTLDSKDIPESLKKGLLEVFGGLKQTVLWKLEEELPDLPSNVHILNWAPQQSILGKWLFIMDMLEQFNVVKFSRFENMM